MNDYIDTREGWREIPVSEHVGQRAILVERDPDGKVTRSWVREEPVPPLPTEPGYYRAADGSVYRLDRDDDDDLIWDDTFGNPQDPDVDIKQPLLRLEPRAVTAKAVLQRVYECAEVQGDMRNIHVHDLIDIECDWGVS